MKMEGDAHTKPGITPGRVTWNVKTCKLSKNTKGTLTLHDCAGSASIEMYAPDAASRAVVLQALLATQKELADCIAAYKNTCAFVERFEAIAELHAAIIKGTPAEPSIERCVPETLRQCPFCGSVDIAIYDYHDGPSATTQATCDVCGSQGPDSVDEDEARKKWNKRI